jgi:hypothetical protein
MNENKNISNFHEVEKQNNTSKTILFNIMLRFGDGGDEGFVVFIRKK